MFGPVDSDGVVDGENDKEEQSRHDPEAYPEDTRTRRTHEYACGIDDVPFWVDSDESRNDDPSRSRPDDGDQRREGVETQNSDATDYDGAQDDVVAETDRAEEESRKDEYGAEVKNRVRRVLGVFRRLKTRRFERRHESYSKEFDREEKRRHTDKRRHVT